MASGAPFLAARIALVTGSASGLGLATARALAARGAHVVLTDIAAAPTAQQAVDEVSQAAASAGGNGRVVFFPADLRSPAEISALFQSIQSYDFGGESRSSTSGGSSSPATSAGVDILVNNAGVQHTARTEVFPPNKWDDLLSVNLSAAFHTTRLALPKMQQQLWGRIVNVASIHGKVASVEKSAYCASKFGIIGLTKVVALENAQAGVTCNCVGPGWMRTPLVEAQIEARAAASGRPIEDEAALLLAEKMPSRRFTDPSEVAEAIVFLCSDAARNVTGSTVMLDGGWTTQ